MQRQGKMTILICTSSGRDVFLVPTSHAHGHGFSSFERTDSCFLDKRAMQVLYIIYIACW